LCSLLKEEKHISLLYGNHGFNFDPNCISFKSCSKENYITFNDDTSSNKIKTLSLINRLHSGFKLTEMRTIVHINSLDTEYLSKVDKNNPGALPLDKKLSLKVFFEIASIIQKRSYNKGLLLLQARDKLIEIIKLVFSGITFYGSIICSILLRRGNWALEETEKRQKNSEVKNSISQAELFYSQFTMQNGYKGIKATINKNTRKKKIKILIITAASLIAAGFISFFSFDDEISIDIKTNLQENKLNKIEFVKYDVIVYDDNFPEIGQNSILNLTLIKKPKIIIFINIFEPSYIKRIMRLGIDGIVSKFSEPQELREAIIKVSRGLKYFCAQIKDKIFISKKYQAIISPREREIIFYLKHGFTTKEIAFKISRSVRTVQNCKDNIRNRLGLKTVKEIAELFNS